MPPFDPYGLTSQDKTEPVQQAETVTPSDSTDLTYVSRALWVGTAGNISVETLAGQTVTLANVSVGWHPIRVTRVNSTGTTASDIVAWS